MLSEKRIANQVKRIIDSGVTSFKGIMKSLATKYYIEVNSSDYSRLSEYVRKALAEAKHNKSSKKKASGLRFPDFEEAIAGPNDYLERMCDLPRKDNGLYSDCTALDVYQNVSFLMDPCTPRDVDGYDAFPELYGFTREVMDRPSTSHQARLANERTNNPTWLSRLVAGETDDVGGSEIDDVAGCRTTDDAGDVSENEAASKF